MASPISDKQLVKLYQRFVTRFGVPKHNISICSPDDSPYISIDHTGFYLFISQDSSEVFEAIAKAMGVEIELFDSSSPDCSAQNKSTAEQAFLIWIVNFTSRQEGGKFGFVFDASTPSPEIAFLKAVSLLKKKEVVHILHNTSDKEHIYIGRDGATGKLVLSEEFIFSHF